MSAAITISVVDHATPALDAAGAALQPAAIKREVGEAVRILVFNHLTKLNADRPNQLGGTRTNFYADAARNTSYAETNDGVTVTVNKQGIRQRFQGGTIRPVKAKYLTIPAIAEAHGRRASDFNFLQVIFGRGGRPVALGERDQTNLVFRKRKGGTQKASQTIGGRIWFWLVKSVTQKPDPSILPSDQEIEETARQAISTAVAAAFQRGGKE